MKISLSRLSTKDLATLAQRTIVSSKSGKYKITENQPLLTALEGVFAKYDEVYTKQAFSGKGKSVAEADEARDKAFSALKNFLWGYQQLSIAPNADKAKELYEIIKTYGTDMDRQSYSTETAQLKKLIEEFEKSDHKASLTALGILPAFKDLKTKQDAFETIFAEQSEANAELRKIPSATALRKDLEKALRTYLDFLKVMKSQPVWEDLYQDINELVKAAKSS
ncbi:MAG: DUF6261 family protein [Flavobacteriaceae bacterium]|nr:DUF6261 family protein [Flavobacteriaceae bacterium]